MTPSPLRIAAALAAAGAVAYVADVIRRRNAIDAYRGPAPQIDADRFERRCERVTLDPEDLPDPALTLDALGYTATGPAAHETGGLLRAYRAGMTGRDLARVLKVPPQKVADSINLAIADEDVAQHDHHLPIHDDPIDPDDTVDDEGVPA